MQVYCVMHNCFPYEGCEYDELDKIFSTREKAQKYVDSIEWSSSYWIDEREIDIPLMDIKKRKPRCLENFIRGESMKSEEQKVEERVSVIRIMKCQKCGTDLEQWRQPSFPTKDGDGRLCMQCYRKEHE